MDPLTATLVAFLCLAASAATGMAVHGHAHRRAPRIAFPMAVRVMVVTLLLLAGAALALATQAVRTTFRDADARLHDFTNDVASLDRALRAIGEPGEAARLLLFRFTERRAREMFPTRGIGLPVESESGVAMREALAAEVAALAARPEFGRSGAVAAQAMENLERACTAIHENPAPELPRWFAAALLAWLMLGLGLLGLLGGPRGTMVVAMVGLATLLAGGVYLVEGAAAPLGTSLLLSQAPLDNALSTITE
ncbi:MAG: hypothetical protein IT555_04640 [Acetobacteraceae bacterium]|nr:hypothetical protein [Acetobacteraceae bacterium]